MLFFLQRPQLCLFLSICDGYSSLAAPATELIAERKHLQHFTIKGKQQSGISLPKRELISFAFVCPVNFRSTYIRRNLCLFITSLSAERMNTVICYQDVATIPAFLRLPSVTKLNHAWWSVQLSRNLGWPYFWFCRHLPRLGTVKNFTSVKLK